VRGLWKLASIEAKLFLREPMGAFFTLAFPLVMLLCFGSVYGNKPGSAGPGLGMMDVTVPGYIAMVVAMTGIFLLPIRMAQYREQRILRRFRVTTVRPHTVLVAQVIVLFTMALLGTALLLTVGRALYHLHISGSLSSIAAAFALGTLSFFAFGFMIAGVAGTTRTAQVMAMVLFYPMIFLSGATIPQQALPASIRHYSQALPLTHVVSLLQGTWRGEAWGQHLPAVAVLGGLLLVGVVVSAVTFRWE
jgi:ABC-2 type transport system permease protein